MAMVATYATLLTYCSPTCFPVLGRNKKIEIGGEYMLSKHAKSTVPIDLLYLPDRPKDEVKFFFFTFFTLSHVEMHNLTIHNKLTYARQHGYGVLSATIDEDMLSEVGGFAVCDHLNAILTSFQNASWFVVIGADHVIMNLAVRLEDIVKGESAAIIVSAEASVINLGMYFLRNSRAGSSFLNTMCAAEEMYKDHVWFDNQFAIEAWTSNGMMRQFMSMLPQRAFNSYPGGVYGAKYEADAVLRCRTTYQAGDFIIHFPGLAKGEKMRRIRDALKKVDSVAGVDPRTRC